MHLILKHKKLLLFILTLLLIFIIYTVNNNKKVNYVALGDSLAAGQNPYGEINYGYTDYIASYLNKNNNLKHFIKDYATTGYRTKDLINDIKIGKTIIYEKEELNIKKALRESNLVTISIGANDFLERLNLNSSSQNLPSISNLKQIIDEIIPKIDEVLLETRRYAKGRVILIGYYNPFNESNDLEELFSYIKSSLEKVSSKYNVDYIDIYDLFLNKPSFLPNKSDIHPNIKGYEAISTEIIRFLEKNK